MRRWYLGFAAAFAGLALWTASLAARRGWQEAADFDIIGFLWLLTNLPTLFAWAMTLLFAVLAVTCLLRAARHAHRNGGAGSEESRMMADPRFSEHIWRQ